MAISVACGCGKQLKVKDEIAGKRARCPACGDVLTIPNAPVIQDNRAKPPIRLTFDPITMTAAEEDDAPYQVQQEEAYQVRPEDVYMPSPTVAAGHGLTRTSQRVAKKTSGGFFGPERVGIEHGVLGGLGMMVLAIVWFVVGLYFDRIFFYPPVLFIIGIFAFFKGLATGNVRGRARA